MDIVGVLNMNAIGVRTQGRSCDMNRLDVNVVTNIKPEMKLRAILNFKAFDC